MISDYKSAVLADSPKAFWPIDFATLGPSPINLHDVTGHGFDPTSSDGNPSMNIAYYQSSPIHGEIGSARFTNSEYVAPLVTTPGDWAFEAWLLGPLPSAEMLAFYNGHWTGTGGGDGYGLGVNSIHNIQLVANGFNTSAGPTPAMTIGGTVGGDQIAISYDSSTTKVSFWQNGVPSPGNPYSPSWFPTAPLPPTSQTYISKNEGSSFVGVQITLLSLAIWSSQLTDAKVLAHYNAMLTMANVDGDYPYLSFVHSGAGTQQPATGRVTIL